MQVNSDSASGIVPEGSAESKAKAQKKLVEELKSQWKLLWSERLNDKVRAEDVSVANYDALRVERGTIIHATRDYKVLNFKEILQQHLVENPDRFIETNNHVGGWTKFVKTEITNRQPPKHKRAAAYVPEKREIQQPKKGGRGWLHAT